MNDWMKVSDQSNRWNMRESSSSSGYRRRRIWIVLDSLRKPGKIRLMLSRHEQGAGFMAATYGRLTGKAGMCLATLGPGAANLVTAAGYAQLRGMPMMMVTERSQKASRANSRSSTSLR